jgi:phage repressor protein C with HTH and peptisase S24 domain
MPLQPWRINLKVLRKKINKTQSDIAFHLHNTQQTIGNWEQGIGEPSVEEFLSLKNYFGISLDNFFKNVQLNTNKEIEKNVKLNVKGHVQLTGKKRSREVVEYQLQEEQAGYVNNVYDIDSKAAAGMAYLLQDVDRFKALPTLYIPNLGTGFHIRLQITGDSMHSTIKDGDRVVATLCANPVQNLREGHIYVIIDRDEEVVCKRIYRAGETQWEFVSDNDIYTPYKRDLNDILAVLRVEEVHTTDLRNYFSDTRKEIVQIWKSIEDIKRKLPK